MSPPPEVAKVCGLRACGCDTRRNARQRLVAALMIVIITKQLQFFLQILGAPERYVVKELSPDGPDEPLDEGVRQWNIGHSLDVVDAEDS